MGQLDISQGTYTDYTNRVSDVTVSTKSTDGVGGEEETYYYSTDFTKWNGYFYSIPDLQSALIMKSIWTMGKGYECDAETKIILEHISGWGKDTFDDILFNLDLVKNINGDSFAEIIRDNETGTLLNLKPLAPDSIKIVVGRNGVIKRYTQISKTKGNDKDFEPDKILHFSKNRYADNIHGISVIAALEQTLLAENESFADLKKIMHHQGKPFILWKLKTDDLTKISQFKSKLETARNLGEDLIIPDDDDSVAHEIVEINVSEFILNWRTDIRNKFYRSLGLPLIIFGSAGSTESGGKIEYLAHEQVFERDQKYIEQQLWNQLQIKINLIPPTSLLDNLQQDQSKDAAQGMEIQPQDMTAAKG